MKTVYLISIKIFQPNGFQLCRVEFGWAVRLPSNIGVGEHDPGCLLELHFKASCRSWRKSSVRLWWTMLLGGAVGVGSDCSSPMRSLPRGRRWTVFPCQVVLASHSSSPHQLVCLLIRHCLACFWGHYRIMNPASPFPSRMLEHSLVIINIKQVTNRRMFWRQA